MREITAVSPGEVEVQERRMGARWGRVGTMDRSSQDVSTGRTGARADEVNASKDCEVAHGAERSLQIRARVKGQIKTGIRQLVLASRRQSSVVSRPRS